MGAQPEAVRAAAVARASALEFVARADVELGEDLVEVVLDSARAMKSRARSRVAAFGGEATTVARLVSRQCRQAA